MSAGSTSPLSLAAFGRCAQRYASTGRRASLDCGGAPSEIEHARPDRGQCGTPWHRTPPGKDAASRPGRRNWSASGDARIANPLEITPSAGHGLLQLPVGYPTRVEREGAYSSRAPSPTRLRRAIEDWRDVVPQLPHSPTDGSSPPPSRSDSARQNPRSARGPLAAPERE